MAITKISGNQVTLGGAIILTAPTIYAAGSYNKLTTSSTGKFKIYGEPAIEQTTTDKTVGSIKIGGLRYFTQKIPFTITSFLTTTLTCKAFDTGKDIPANAVVTDAWFDIHTAVSTGVRITAGTELDPNGFLNGIAVQVATAKLGEVTANTSETYGVLFLDAGSPTSGNNYLSKVNYVSTGARNIFIGRSATTLKTNLVADLYVHYMLPATS